MEESGLELVPFYPTNQPPSSLSYSLRSQRLSAFEVLPCSSQSIPSLLCNSPDGISVFVRGKSMVAQVERAITTTIQISVCVCEGI